MDYAARDRNPTLPRSRARRRIHFSVKGVLRQVDRLSPNFRLVSSDRNPPVAVGCPKSSVTFG
jgi:hypothetical protein